ncbi:MAG: protein-ADP-ribose hydrolase [Bacteroidales bacterium]|nr:protein-ADP-ribose hydrolase [Bacteroidales bacterium]MBQ6955638.1 protein-ADP-ribose hydrolase [Bacteroidales bacterium]
MDRIENIDFCIRYLLEHNRIQADIPAKLAEKQRLLRALMNVWEPQPLSREFLRAQDAELQAQLQDKGVVSLEDISASGCTPLLWQGDITRLRVDAIVNAANSRMMGCWHPLHACIDNCIHSAAGLQLRAECAEAMSGAECPPVHPEYTMGGTTYRHAFTSEALITEAYNLPCRHVLHTVGPIIPDGVPTRKQEEQLANCYRNCLGLAEANGCRSIAFCCISTGEFHFPNRRAAEIAVEACKDATIKVVFNIFKDIDYDIYRELLGKA